MGLLPTVPSRRIGSCPPGVAKVAVELAATAYNESVVAGAAWGIGDGPPPGPLRLCKRVRNEHSQESCPESLP
jgi:hypothetical protein